METDRNEIILIENTNFSIEPYNELEKHVELVWRIKYLLICLRSWDSMLSVHVKEVCAKPWKREFLIIIDMSSNDLWLHAYLSLLEVT